MYVFAIDLPDSSMDIIEEMAEKKGLTVNDLIEEFIDQKIVDWMKVNTK